MANLDRTKPDSNSPNESSVTTAVSRQELLDEIKSLKKGSLIKDILLVIIPLAIAGLTIYSSHKISTKQLSFSDKQLSQNLSVQNAQIIQSSIDSILKGGRDADIAKIALETVPITNSQREQLNRFFETPSDASDVKRVPNSGISKIDKQYQKLLGGLFDAEKSVRANAYSGAKGYFQQHGSPELVTQMFDAIEGDPFNINGRSNVLSILATVDPQLLRVSSSIIRTGLDNILALEGKNPAYAVGPQTKGWISTIQANLSGS